MSFRQFVKQPRTPLSDLAQYVFELEIHAEQWQELRNSSDHSGRSAKRSISHSRVRHGAQNRDNPGSRQSVQHKIVLPKGQMVLFELN